MFVGAPSSSNNTRSLGSTSAKWNVENFQTAEGRAKCADSIKKDNDVNKIPVRVFDVKSNVRKNEGESMAEFYARKRPHASLLLSDPEVQAAVLNAYIKNPETLNPHVSLAMASVAPSMNAERQDAIVAEMGHDWDALVKADPHRALVLRFLHSISPACQNFVAKKISDGLWGGSGTILEYVCANLSMFDCGQAKKMLVDAICSERLKFDSVKDKKILAQVILDGDFGDDPKLLEALANKLTTLFAADNISEGSIVAHLQILETLAQAVRLGRLGTDPKVSEDFAAFRSAEIGKIFAQATSSSLKKELANAISEQKFGTDLQVQKQLVENLGVFATSDADVVDAASFDLHLQCLNILVMVVGSQGFGKDPQVLKTLAERSGVFVVDSEKLKNPQLYAANKKRITEISDCMTVNIAGKKFYSMTAGGAGLKALERFKADLPGQPWDLQAFTGLGHERVESASRMNVDENVGAVNAGTKRRAVDAAESDVGGGDEPKRPRINAPAGAPPLSFLGGIASGMAALKKVAKPNNDDAPVQGASVASSSRLAQTPVQKQSSSGAASQPAATPLRGNLMAEMQAAQAARSARKPKADSQTDQGGEGNTSQSSQTPQRASGVTNLFLASALSDRRQHTAPMSPVPGSNNSSPDKWGTPKEEG